MKVFLSKVNHKDIIYNTVFHKNRIERGHPTLD